MSRMFVVCGLLACLLLAAGCPNHTPSSSPPATQEQEFGPSHYIRRTNADTVIVFVHGIFGGSIGTWTNSETHAYWPNLLLDDPAFKGADVYVYSYSTPYFGPSYTIDELIENVRLVLENDEVFQSHKRVVFLCHSMGGLVVRGYLKRYQAQAVQVPLISFYSTPTAGAQITQLARFLSKNPQLKGMLPAHAGDFVTDLQHDWRALPTHPNSHCAYETLDTYGIRIVDEQSATALCDGPVDPIRADHIDIVKPRDKNDVSYIAFREAFQASQQPATGNAPAQAIGTVQTARSVDVDCGQVRDDTALIPPPIDMKPEQKIVDAVASLQQASNLKEQQVEAKGLDPQQSAKVHYHLVGLDKPANGVCPAKGFGVILVSFIVSQPQDMATVGFTPLENDKLFLALASKPGTFEFKNVKDIQPINAQPVPARNTLLYRNQLYLKQVDMHFAMEKIHDGKESQ